MSELNQIKRNGHQWVLVHDRGEYWKQHFAHIHTVVHCFYWKRVHGEVRIFPPRTEGDVRIYVERQGDPLQCFPSIRAAFFYAS